MGTHELDRVLRCKGVIRALPGDGFKLALASLPYPPQWLGEAVGGIYDLFLGKPPGAGLQAWATPVIRTDPLDPAFGNVNPQQAAAATVVGTTGCYHVFLPVWEFSLDPESIRNGGVTFQETKDWSFLTLPRETPLPLRFVAFEVILSGFAGGECLPLPVSKGPAFPFLLTLDGYPTSPADYAHGQCCSPWNRQNSP
jgi:hypothetical protein